MAEIQKTDTSKSPLLRPVIERDYTKGMDFNKPGAGSPAPEVSSQKTAEPGPSPQPGPGAVKEPSPNFDKPGDTTKGFAFDEVTGAASDLDEGDQGPAVTIPTGSARTFANTVGNLVQIYLPRATYGYVKIDMDNVRMNVAKGLLTGNWIDTFENINASAEEALKIPDDVIKMWKAAFQHYLEYKQLAFANPETEFWVATATLLTDQGIRVYGLNKTMKDYMRQALEACNPGLIVKKGGGEKKAEVITEQLNNRQNGESKAA